MTSTATSASLASAHYNAGTAARRVFAALCATLVVALAAHISFPLPFTPVPFTLQPLAVLGVGLALGPLDGALAMLAYLLEGASGLPVFSPAGPGGLFQLFGATGGFLLSYPLVAAIAGGLTRRLTARFSAFPAAVVGCFAAVVLLFLAGAFWLHSEAHLSAHTVWLDAVAPFLPGEAVKVVAAAGVYRAFKHPRSGRQPAL